MKIRLIEEKDNKEVEKLIRDCLIEFGGNKPGCAWEDKDLGQFYQVYQPAHKQYLVVVENDHVVGGCGIGPVSYTHLDVYKRQEYSLRNRCSRIIKWSNG